MTNKEKTLGNFNINLLFQGKEILINKIADTLYKEMLALTRKYLKFCFLYSLEQTITSLIRTTYTTKTLLHHVLTNSPHKVTHLGVTDLVLPDHNLKLSTRKTSKPKSHKHNEILVQSLKHNRKTLKEHWRQIPPFIWHRNNRCNNKQRQTTFKIQKVRRRNRKKFQNH